VELKLKAVSAATLLALSTGAVYANGGINNGLVKASLKNQEVVNKASNSNAAKERVIVKFTPGKASAAKSAAAKAGGEVKLDLAKHNAFAMEVPVAALNGLRNNPNIEYIETDVQRKLLNTNLNNTEVTPWGIDPVQSNSVSDNLAGNKTVCIIDSGYDIRHPDLSGNNVSGTNDSGTGDWSTPGGSHGTHVAGTVAAVNNGSGVVGVMPNGNVNLHIIKVFNESGWGYSSSLVAAADACVDAGSDVISMSLGGGSSSRTERNAFDSYFAQGILNIAAAGNDGNTAHSYPASYDAVMSVAAVDSGNMHANFSQRTSQVEISGPGEAVLSSVGLGDGQLAQLTVGGTDYFANGVVPHTFYNSSLSYDARANDGSASGTLGVCTTSGTTYTCGDMTNKICLVERAENQADNTSSTENNYPEYRAANACADAGAAGIVVYSNAARPGLQAPFMVDFNGKIEGVPTASVDRATGLALAAKAGQTASMSKAGNQDWEYYNGTSMATPHVSAVAALVWSHHAACTATEIRNALNNTALDLDAAGRDVKTGYGMVQAQAAVSYLDANGCAGGGNSNQTPTASFTYSCDALACSFDGSGSSDSDGNIASYSWNLGDGSNASGQTTSNTYSASGSYSVTLTVTDNEGASSSSTKTVTVSDGAASNITLSLSSRKRRGTKYVDLAWSGVNGGSVDVYRTYGGSTSSFSTANDGAHTETVSGRGTYTYKVCESGSNTCSDEMSVYVK